MDKEKSKCCNASIKIDCANDLGEIGTCHFICKKCKKPCDIQVAEKEIKEWKEFLKGCKAKQSK